MWNKKSVILCFFIFSLFFTTSVTAETTEDNFIYTIASGNVTITDYAGTTTDIVIPNEIEGKPVTTIGNKAFQNKNITSVVIPASVTSIGIYAFSTNNLTSIVFSDNLKIIGDNAFENNKLTSVVIPEGLTNIGAMAFINNEISVAVIPSRTTIIIVNAFYDNQENPKDLVVYIDKNNPFNSLADHLGYTFKDVEDFYKPILTQDVRTTLNEGNLSIESDSKIDSIHIDLGTTSELKVQNLGTLNYKVTDNRGVADNYTVNMSISPFTKEGVSLSDFTLIFNENQTIKSEEKKQIFIGDPREDVIHSGAIHLDELTLSNNQFIESGEYQATLTLEVISSPL